MSRQSTIELSINVSSFSSAHLTTFICTQATVILSPHTISNFQLTFIISCHYSLSSLPYLSFLHLSCLYPYLSSSCHHHRLHRQALDPKRVKLFSKLINFLLLLADLQLVPVDNWPPRVLNHLNPVLLLQFFPVFTKSNL